MLTQDSARSSRNVILSYLVDIDLQTDIDMALKVTYCVAPCTWKTVRIRILKIAAVIIIRLNIPTFWIGQVVLRDMIECQVTHKLLSDNNNVHIPVYPDLRKHEWHFIHVHDL